MNAVVTTPKEILIRDGRSLPLLLVCDSCRGPFMWSEWDGEPGAWCWECSKKFFDKISPVRRAVYVARANKWGTTIMSQYWWEKYQDSAVEWEYPI